MRLETAIQGFLSGYFSTHHRAAKTRAAYASDLQQFLNYAKSETDIRLLKATTIEAWAADLNANKYSPSSIRRKIAALKVFCAYWVRKEVVSESPFWRVKLSFGRIQQLPRTLSESELRTLLSRAQQECDEKRSHQSASCSNSSRYRVLRNLALIELLFGTGIRVGEAASLDVDNYITDERAFRIKGKGGRDRLAFVVDQKAVKILNDYVRLRREVRSTTEALFLNPCGKRLSAQGIANVVNRLRCQTKIERPITPHMFRHTVATLLLRNGADIRVVQEFLGHASIVTTQRYTHVAKEHLVAVLERRHPSLQLRSE